MAYLPPAVIVLAALLGVALTLLTLPGIWFMLLCALLVQWLWQPLFSWWTLAAIAGLAVLGEIVEMGASAAGASRAGAGRWGAWGSVIGGIVGALAGTFLLPIPIIGTVIGAVAGAGIGAIVAERGIAQRTWAESAKAGAGAATGRLAAVLAKTAIACLAALILSIAAFVT